MGVSFVTLVGICERYVHSNEQYLRRPIMCLLIFNMGVLSNLRGLLIDTKTDEAGDKGTQNR